MDKKNNKRWFQLKPKNKSNLQTITSNLEQSLLNYCFLADLPDQRGCCMRLKKDFFKNRLLLEATTEEINEFMQQNAPYLRYIGQYGKPHPPLTPKAYRQLTLFFDKLDRDFTFEPAIPPKASAFRLPGGNMAGIEGHLEYRGIGGYRLYLTILDLCIVSIRVDKKELTATERILSTPSPEVPHWYVLLSRREREYNRLLQKRGYESYLPIRREIKESGETEEKIILRGYVFIRLSPINFRNLFADIPGSSDRLLFDRSKEFRTPLIIPDKQFEDFVFVTEFHSPDIHITQEVPHTGDTVRLLKKGFEGIEGTLQKNGSRFHIFISLPHLQSGYLISVKEKEFIKI